MKLALLAVPALAALLLSPSANASPNNPTPAEAGFVAALAIFGFHHVNGQANLIRAGWEICDELRSGVPDDVAIYDLWAKTDWSIDANDASYIVGAAQGALCPDTIGRTLA